MTKSDVDGLDVFAIAVVVGSLIALAWAGFIFLVVGLLTSLTVKAPLVLLGLIVIIFTWSIIRVWRLFYGKV